MAEDNSQTGSAQFALQEDGAPCRLSRGDVERSSAAGMAAIRGIAVGSGLRVVELQKLRHDRTEC